MGIPTYFRFLLESYHNIIVEKNSYDCDYFFLDFNSILYKVLYDNEKNKLYEDVFLRNIIRELKNICNNVLLPKKMIYFSMDGPCPRAKMVQQRSRRFKSIQLQKYCKKEEEWNPSNNICPGTPFMARLKRAILQSIMNKEFHCPLVILNDSSVPGEGEHKILPVIRELKKKDPDSKIFIMSPDNDLISLGILTGKKNTYIVRYMDRTIAGMLRRETFDKQRIILIDLNILKEHFAKDQKSKLELELDEENLLLDYNFLLSMIGNDFVVSLPYMKIKSGGLDKLIRIYNNIFRIKKEYLIFKDSLNINMPFFTEIITNLSRMENNEFSNLALFIEKEKNTTRPPHHDNDMTEEKIFETNLQHLNLCNPFNPLHDLYQKDFEIINFAQSKHEWKFQYYQYFCGATTQNYNKIRNNMVREYLQSLKFTLYYYNDRCPSWSWFYPYRVAPLFSDIYTNLTKFNFNMNTDLSFRMGNPYTPFQQLMLILPSESKNILPKEFAPLFEKYNEYYPEEFRVDALQGMKYIYSEAILPEFTRFLEFLSDIKKVEEKLNDMDKQRNKISKNIYKIAN